jgi:galactokinase
MDIEKLKRIFFQNFGESVEKENAYFSPGRVNLIGDHTDYNGGYVLPCTIDKGTYLIVRKNALNKVRLKSENFQFSTDVSISEVSNKVDGQWVNYPLGVIDQFLKSGHPITGLDLLFYGNLPHSAGLSSSASIEMVTAMALNVLTGAGYTNKQLALIAQKAEIEYVGVNCGIMDQMVVALGKNDHALFLDCTTLNHSLIKLNLEGYKIVVANTNVPRTLSGSKYNERVAECNSALKFLSKVRPLKNLSEFSFREYVGIKHFIPDITIRKRATHVLSENQRVLDAVAALGKNNLRLFGKLMNASHNSLRYNYEVSCNELDVLAEVSRNVEGVLGSRMTGAGFGGCIVSLVENSALELYRNKVADSYQAKTGLKADIYEFEIDDNIRKIDLNNIL